MNEERIKKHLGYLIRTARTDAKITQIQLAKLAKTKQSSIARAEKVGCDIALAEKCLNIMGFTLDNNAMRSIDTFKTGLTFAS